jgi:uncharacterized protein YydD (DUF2326 family)
MILLKRLFSKLDGLFEEVVFHNGINAIYGEKTENSTRKDSLNSIGKSTLLDCINFCLLSNPPSRLKKGKEFLLKYSFVLELDVDGKTIYIERNLKTEKKIMFGSVIDDLKEYNLEDLKRVLCNIFYKNKDYKGYFSDNWFRKLTPFFLKIQQKKKKIYKDAVLYFDNLKTLEAIQYNLFLINIDNTLAKRNYEVKNEINRRKPVLKEIESFVKETYGVKDIDEAKMAGSNITKEIKKISDSIEIFKLGDSYEVVEKKANTLTLKIKDLLLNNNIDEMKHDNYLKNITNKVTINKKKIQSIYNEIKDSLGLAVGKAIEDAVKFKNDLLSSRKEFMQEEIDSLKKLIETRTKEITALDAERTKLFVFLSEKDAIKDLTNAFFELQKKREELNQIESKINTYKDFQREILELQKEDASLSVEINNFLEKVKKDIEKFSEICNNIYNTIYEVSENKSIFDIVFKEKRDSKIEILIDDRDADGEGKGRGCVMIYDLAILFKAIIENRTFPFFLIHDGVFDAIHKGHFVSLMNYLEEKSKTTKFQYVFTANKEDVFMSDEVDCGKLSFDLEKKAVAILTPEHKFFGRDY